MITLVAVLLQVDALTQNPAAVGLVGLVQLVPLMAASLLGGSIIDRLDRRRLLLIAQIGQAGAAGLLFLSATLDHPPLILIYVGAGLVAGLSGFSPVASVLSGGLLCIVGVVTLAWRSPAFLRYRPGDRT